MVRFLQSPVPYDLMTFMGLFCDFKTLKLAKFRFQIYSPACNHGSMSALLLCLSQSTPRSRFLLYLFTCLSLRCCAATFYIFYLYRLAAKSWTYLQKLSAVGFKFDKWFQMEFEIKWIFKNLKSGLWCSCTF